MKIEGSTILVTGGCSGLGAACAARFVREGAKVIVADLGPPREEAVKEFGNKAVFLKADVTKEGDLRTAISIGTDELGALRGVVCCAGILYVERLLPKDSLASLEQFRRVIDINLIGTFNTLRLAAEAIIKSPPLDDGERGVMVMTSSVAAFEGQIGQAAYAASKGAVAAMVLPLARELAMHGIRVNAIAPGTFDTPMMQLAPDKVRQSLIDQIPFPHRLGDPDEFASLVCHLFENRMLNGSVVRLDGAMRMGPK
jgi:NAD(P)-dependent dehydrogenase (short-subunit alcohol dehydrogenase family)